MFKKRTNNNNKAQAPKLCINLLDQIGNIEANNSSVITQSANVHQTYESPLNMQDTVKLQRNQISEKLEVQQEDQEYLQHLQRDKKLQALFSSLLNESENASDKIQTIDRERDSNNIQETFRPMIKTKSQIKFVLPSQKKVNLYSALTQDNQNQKIKTINETKTKQSQGRNQKASQDKDIQDLFKQIAQQHKQQEQQQATQINTTPPTSANPQPKPNQFIIQDSDQYIQQIPQTHFLYKQPTIDQASLMSVQVDYEGNLSPQVSQNDNPDILQDNFHEQDFEDQLIRKTLTRHNYMKLQQNNNLRETKLAHKKDRLLNTVLKTSWQDIDTRISSDISLKVNKRDQLRQQMNYLQDRLEQRSSQIDRKKTTLKQLQLQQNRLKKVIYFICYFGDQLLKPQESIQSLFQDLTPNIILKIQKLANKVGIQEFMEKKRTRDELRDKYRNGRKKIKANGEEDQEEGGEVIREQQQDQEDEDDDGECFMEDDY